MTLSTLLKSIKRGDHIITPRLHVWLMQNDGVMVSPAVADRIRDLIIKGKARDRSGGFHPSQMGGCQRAHMFTYLGAASRGVTDSQLQNLFNDGTWRHLRWQAMLMEAGLLTDIEVPVRNKKYRITASMDGVNDDEGFGFELKGTRSITKPMQEGVMPDHMRQVATYFLVRRDLQKFSVIYEDKAGQHWIEHVLDRNDDDMKKAIAEVRAEAVVLNDHRTRKALPAIQQECSNGKGATFRKCQYREICLGASWKDVR